MGTGRIIDNPRTGIVRLLIVTLDVARDTNGIGPSAGKLREEATPRGEIVKAYQAGILTDVVHVRNAQPAGRVKSDANHAHIGVYDVHMLLL